MKWSEIVVYEVVNKVISLFISDSHSVKSSAHLTLSDPSSDLV